MGDGTFKPNTFYVGSIASLISIENGLVHDGEPFSHSSNFETQEGPRNQKSMEAYSCIKLKNGAEMARSKCKIARLTLARFSPCVGGGFAQTIFKLLKNNRLTSEFQKSRLCRTRQTFRQDLQLHLRLRCRALLWFGPTPNLMQTAGSQLRSSLPLSMFTVCTFLLSYRPGSRVARRGRRATKTKAKIRGSEISESPARP